MSGFGSGEYRAAFIEVEQARYEFLLAVRRRCPSPLIRLRSRVAPFYFRWVEECISDARAKYQWDQSPEGLLAKEKQFAVLVRAGMPEDAARKAAEGRPIVGFDPDDPTFFTLALLQFHCPRLDRLLKRWARRHHLTHQVAFEEQMAKQSVDSDFVHLTLHEDFWACEWALHTMWCWRFVPEGTGMMNSEPPEWIRMSEQPSISSDEPAFRICPGWDVLAEGEQAFRERVDATLNSYINRQRELAGTRGLVEPLNKRQPRHFDWLALYQVGGWNYPDIAQWEQEQPGRQKIDDSTIRKGVQDAAEMCALNTRAGKPGRPVTRK
jgi:hypothetical protein